MLLQEAQAQVAQQLGLSKAEVELIWSVVADTPEVWKALKAQARAVIAAEDGVLHSSEDLHKMLRAQGRIQGVGTFIENVEGIAGRVEASRGERDE